MPTSAALRERALNLMRHPMTGRWLRYAAGSVVSFGVSEVTFVLLFGSNTLGAKGASGLASVAGMVPGYFLNRNWTWGGRGRSSVKREVLPYWITVATTTVLAALIVGWANSLASGEPRGVRTVINALTYMVVYLFFFVAKFLIFDVLFRRHRESGERPPRPRLAEVGER